MDPYLVDVLRARERATERIFADIRPKRRRGMCKLKRTVADAGTVGIWPLTANARQRIAMESSAVYVCVCALDAQMSIMCL